MTTHRLREAAAALREKSLHRTDPISARTDRAVADWLDHVAHDPASYTARADTDHARAVAAAVLDESPIDLIPTEAGLDYLADRREQHPRGATE